MIFFCDEDECEFWSSDIQKLKDHQIAKHVGQEKTQDLIKKTITGFDKIILERLEKNQNQDHEKILEGINFK